MIELIKPSIKFRYLDNINQCNTCFRQGVTLCVCLSGTSSIRVSSSFSLQSLSGLSQSHVWFRSLSGLSPLSGLFSLQALSHSILAYFVEHTESKILRLVQFLKHPKIDQSFIPARPSPTYILPLSVWLANQASYFFLLSSCPSAAVRLRMPRSGH